MNEAGKIREHLFSLENKGIKYDLDRMRVAAHMCGNPQNSYKSFHVAGTNGKGSTCTYIDSVLRTAGYRCGLYTSPHILNFEERFIIDGVPVSENDWLSVYLDQKKVIDDLNLTFFEAATLIAFELFRRKKVDWAVFETGLGGRLDATNIIIPEVSVITGIAVDHTQYLGNTLVSIATEKLGIVKDGSPLVFAENNDKEVMELARKTCAQKESLIQIVSRTEATEIEDNESGVQFTWQKKKISLPLHGFHQVSNAMCAIKALELAGINNSEMILKGLASAFVPARFQIVKHEGRIIILDVGHNPDGASVVADTILRKFRGKTVCIVTGIMKDKDMSGILAQYSKIANHILLARPQIARAAKPEELLEKIDHVNLQKCELSQTVADAVQCALNRNEELICITGSFYTVGEAFRFLNIDPYKSSNNDI